MLALDSKYIVVLYYIFFINRSSGIVPPPPPPPPLPTLRDCPAPPTSYTQGLSPPPLPTLRDCPPPASYTQGLSPPPASYTQGLFYRCWYVARLSDSEYDLHLLILNILYYLTFTYSEYFVLFNIYLF